LEPVLQFTSWDKGGSIPLRVTLKLPRLWAGWSIHDLWMSCPTKPTHSHIFPSAAGHDSVLYSFEAHIGSFYGYHSDTFLVINHRDLLHRLRGSTQCQDSLEGLIWEWHVWGEAARFIPLGALGDVGGSYQVGGSSSSSFGIRGPRPSTCLCPTSRRGTVGEGQSLYTNLSGHHFSLSLLAANLPRDPNPQTTTDIDRWQDAEVWVVLGISERWARAGPFVLIVR
jgi:hypothetical protein